jgi:hypothetical protein
VFPSIKPVPGFVKPEAAFVKKTAQKSLYFAGIAVPLVLAHPASAEKMAAMRAAITMLKEYLVFIFSPFNWTCSTTEVIEQVYAQV